jgi:hypothetical protein
MKLHHVTIVDTVVDEIPSFHFAFATLTLKVMMGTISEMTIQFPHRLGETSVIAAVLNYLSVYFIDILLIFDFNELLRIFLFAFIAFI